MVVRCAWASETDLLMQRYHDTEWGVPQHNDTMLFELLTLEGAQAGLSWRTILTRRDAYREAFHGFDVDRVARMRERELERLLTGSGIIRNRQKVFSVRNNAVCSQHMRDKHGSLDAYLWSFVDRNPIVNRWSEMRQVPPSTQVSDRMSKQLRKDGFSFVGTTICYSLMQASGMVNDHLVNCFRYSPP